MSAPRHKLRANKSSGGFSLVEILVGMLIGLLGMLIMLQMLSFSEGQKRTTAGSDDAQNAGAIALYGIQRDIQQSGYGISTQNIIGCSLTWQTSVDLAIVSVPLAPVTINSNLISGVARDANTDTVMVIYGNSNGGEEGDTVSGQPAQTQYKTVTPTSYNPKDNIIAQYGARQSPCSLTADQVATAYVNGTNPVTVNTGIANLTTTNKSTTGSFPMLYNLGQSPKVLVYAVRGGNLTVCDFTAYNCGAYNTINTANQAVWVPIAGNIVSMKALYGRDTNAGNMNGIVDTWDQQTPPFAPAINTGLLSCDWGRISGIEIALVAQGNIGPAGSSGSPPVTWATLAGTWTGAAVGQINLTAVANWNSYHYKIFQTTVPLRNITIQAIPALASTGASC